MEKNKFNINIISNNDPICILSIKNGIWHFNIDYVNENENWGYDDDDREADRHYSRIINDSLFGFSYSIEYKIKLK
jgi:hypothetical protein